MELRRGDFILLASIVIPQLRKHLSFITRDYMVVVVVVVAS
jgi:hypothetical protein